MIEEIRVDCPYCGAAFDTLADCSAGDQEYTEDCRVCCQPIVFRIYTDAEGRLADLHTRREDD